jgi:cephalosporin hydroxylase
VGFASAHHRGESQVTAYSQFKQECAAEIAEQGKDAELVALSTRWLGAANARKYSYHFEWLGRPIIQYPQDILAMQELIWQTQPDLIIETGIAHGGSLIFSASMLELNAACGGPADARVLGIDIDIRSHNRAAIEAHPLSRRIEMLQGSSIAPDIVARVHARAAAARRILVCLDSNHTHAHVLAELQAYAPLASVGSYCVVFDTVIEDLPPEMFGDRPWGRGDNPKTAVWEYLRTQGAAPAHGASAPAFEIDRTWQDKYLVTVAPDGYLRRVR